MKNDYGKAGKIKMVLPFVVKLQEKISSHL
jgi:hypothetical protein